MKIVLVLLLITAVAHASLVPRNVVIPDNLLNPRLTGAEWSKIYASQSYTPEVVENIQPGTAPQPDDAAVGSVDSKIIGGNSAVRGQFPFQVSIFLDKSGFCGGSIISSHWVLTAGHCVYGVSSFRLVFGSVHPYGEDASFAIQDSRISVLHQRYNPSTLTNDIALIYLYTPLTFSDFLDTIRLPTNSDYDTSFEGHIGTISGWGTTNTSAPGINHNLMYADLLIVNNNICTNHYEGMVSVTNMCADSSTGRSACNGDYGGPLFERRNGAFWHQIGITSFGSNEGCDKGRPVVFTRVTYYLYWINSVTGIPISD